MVFKKHLTPLSKKGSIVKHEGKGAKPFQSPPPSMWQPNNYAKALPLPQGPTPAMDADGDFDNGM